MPITSRLFESSIRCRYKAHLQAMGESGNISPYERLTTDLDRGYLEESLRKWRARLGAEQVLDTPESLVLSVRKGYELITNAAATTDRWSVVFQALERVSGDNGTQQYVPLVFTHREKITGPDKLLAAFYALALADLLGTPPTQAKIVHGCDGTATKILLVKLAGMTEVGAKARRLVDELTTQVGSHSPPPLTLNDHCRVCEFQERCHAAAVEKDDISLLRCLSVGEVEQWRERGVFTVTQLSYTFRAKRVAGKRADKVLRQLPALQALAVREKKVYLAHLPELPAVTTRVFLDVEGVPDRDFYYLIGALVEQDGQTRAHSLWADGPEDERRIWHDLLALLANLGTFAAYHYGRYERTFFDRMTARYGVPVATEAVVERLKTKSVDVLAAMTGRVYFPAYSRSLKVTGSLVGALWSDSTASGLQSLVWRHRWEGTKDAALKVALAQYNLEDCFALRTVTEVMERLSRGAASALNVVWPDDLPASPVYRFGMGRPATPEIGRIIKCAYFDYQTNKVFFRTDASIRASVRRKKVRWRTPRINAVIACPQPQRCPRCGSERFSVYRKQPYSKVRFDLRFSPSGIRRWVVRYETLRYHCTSCLGTCVSDVYPKRAGRFGHALASWAIHAHVALKQSFADVTSCINDAFGYSFTYPILHMIKPQLAKEYRKTQEVLLAKLRTSHVLYVDETKVRSGAKKGYLWTFTNLQETVFLFNAVRDGTVLEQVLQGFEGVLVSDFYSIYDSPACEQQKCVVHFLRDLNDDLKKYALDEELVELAKQFTVVFTPIIATIDKYGLKQRHLNKHRAEADRFLKGIAAREYRSKVVAGYQRRLAKYGRRMFTFLSYDGVAWNNNAAENAIKLFAGRRRVIGGSFTENGIGDYLLFLGIFCTLRRKGASFLKFLLSGEKDIDVFLGQRFQRSEATSTMSPKDTPTTPEAAKPV